jgi:RES domain-containing protein
MVYTSESVALAALERLARTRILATLPGQVVVPAVVPDDAIVEMAPAQLPPDWKQFPHPASTKNYGGAWIQSQSSLAIKVPSVVAPGSNILINPLHPRFADVIIEAPIADAFDERLGEPPRP